MTPLQKAGKTLALYGATGSGKTSQIGEEAKRVHSETGKRTLLRSIDPGGYDSIEHLAGPDGIIDVELIGEENPWVWIQEKVLNPPDFSIYGMLAYDSATGMGDLLLKDAARLAAEGVQVGQQKVFTLKIPGAKPIGTNNESQYGLVQTFMLDQINRASRLAVNHGFDVLWTFGEHYPGVGESPVVGPKLVGKALTTQLPRHIRYTLRMVQMPQLDGAAVHRLLTQPRLEQDGMTTCLVNPRFPLNSEVELPLYIEPASVPEFWTLIERAKKAALL